MLHSLELAACRWVTGNCSAWLSPEPPALSPLPQGFDLERARPVVKGDSKVLCIAAASVIAKVTRDRLMEAYHEKWPQYNFAGG